MALFLPRGSPTGPAVGSPRKFRCSWWAQACLAASGFSWLGSGWLSAGLLLSFRLDFGLIWLGWLRLSFNWI